MAAHGDDEIVEDGALSGDSGSTKNAKMHAPQNFFEQNSGVAHNNTLISNANAA